MGKYFLAGSQMHMLQTLNLVQTLTSDDLFSILSNLLDTYCYNIKNIKKLFPNSFAPKEQIVTGIERENFPSVSENFALMDLSME